MDKYQNQILKDFENFKSLHSLKNVTNTNPFLVESEQGFKFDLHHLV